MRKTNVAASENAYYETDVSNATDAGAVASSREIEIASGSEIASTADGGTGVAIDLNSDMGESFGRWKLGDDEALLQVVSSANVACGFHAGDPSVMLRTLEYAASRGVVVGTHVAYRDLAGFGRRYVDAAPAELRADVMYQIAALEGVARSVGAAVRYVKPHGALYNRIVRDEVQAQAVVDAIRSVDDSLAILTQPGAVVGQVAEAEGLQVFHEAFADRAYNADGTLVSRRLPGAVITDPAEVAARVLRMVQCHEVEAIDGSIVALHADSVCVHGDSPFAVAMARAVRARLEAEAIVIRSFAPSMSDSAESDSQSAVTGAWMSVSGESDNQTLKPGPQMTDSAESDNQSAKTGVQLSVSPESDTQAARGRGLTCVS